jgi:hypothetical protein
MMEKSPCAVGREKSDIRSLRIHEWVEMSVRAWWPDQVASIARICYPLEIIDNKVGNCDILQHGTEGKVTSRRKNTFY